MERERSLENDRRRRRTTVDGPAGEDDLDQQRAEVDALLQASDQIFDSINNPQQYLEQNLQTGGQ